ncbi:unnamed protein product [Heterobilharzia americana]|nr:unnamed protein product [Heterobilharzia americana]
MVRVTLKYFVYTFAILLSLSLYLEYANASGLFGGSENATATTTKRKFSFLHYYSLNMTCPQNILVPMVILFET